MGMSRKLRTYQVARIRTVTAIDTYFAGNVPGVINENDNANQVPDGPGHGRHAAPEDSKQRIGNRAHEGHSVLTRAGSELFLGLNVANHSNMYIIAVSSLLPRITVIPLGSDSR